MDEFEYRSSSYNEALVAVGRVLAARDCCAYPVLSVSIPSAPLTPQLLLSDGVTVRIQAPMADQLFVCSCCENGNRSHSLLPPSTFTRNEFLQHLKDNHLVIKELLHQKLYTCRYGSQQTCSSSMDFSSESNSLSEYESHIIRCHLPEAQKSAASSRFVGSTGTPFSVRTYQTVKDLKSKPMEGSSDPLIMSRSLSQRHSIASNGTESSRKWTSVHSTVNMAAVLNDPSHRQADIFSRTWGDLFEYVEVHPSPHLEEVNPKIFERYLRRTVPRLKAIEVAASRPMNTVNAKTAMSSAELQSLHDLETIPKMFFSSTFDLSHPATFASVISLFDNQSQSGAAAQAAGWLKTFSVDTSVVSKQADSLHNKLSHYLDIVEVLIAKQVSKKSGSFFEAMSSHDAVREGLTTTLTQIRNTRQKMSSINKCCIADNLRLLVLHRRKLHYQNLYRHLQLVSTVHSAHPTLQTLLSGSDFCGALDLISTTQDIVQNELGRLHCFRHLTAQLHEMDTFVERMIHSEFAQSLQIQLSASNRERSAASMDEYQLTPYLLGMLRMKNYHFVEMLRFEVSQQVKDIVRSTVQREISLLVDANHFEKQNVSPMSRSTEADGVSSQVSPGQQSPTPSSRSAGGSSETTVTPTPLPPSLVEQMRQLGYGDWMNLFLIICQELGAFVKQVKRIGETMRMAVLSLSAPPNSGGTIASSSGGKTVLHPNGNSTAVVPADVSQRLCEELDRLYNDVLLVAQNRLVKVITVRGKDGFFEKLSSAQFVQLETVLQHFLEQLGVPSTARASSQTLLALRQQASRLAARFHEERRHKLGLILDNERWKQADVPKEFQQLANSFRVENGTLSMSEALQSRSSAGAPSPLLSTSLLVEGGTSSSSPNPTTCQMQTPPETLQSPMSVLPTIPSSAALVLGQERFVVVGTALLLFRMILEYCQYVEDIPFAAADILMKLTDLLKMFNSRTCQLVLGAGALQMVGLKTISTKNLALASRCLQLILFLVPLIRNHFQRHLHSHLSHTQPALTNGSSAVKISSDNETSGNGQDTSSTPVAVGSSSSSSSSSANSVLKALASVDQVEKLYREHIEEISNKLLSIMDLSLSGQMNSWNAKPPVPSQEMRTVCKHFAKLHEAICDVLPMPQITELFMRIHGKFKTRLRSRLVEIDVKNNNSPQHGLVISDLSFYMDSIHELPGLDSFRDDFHEVWQSCK